MTQLRDFLIRERNAATLCDMRTLAAQFNLQIEINASHFETESKFPDPPIGHWKYQWRGDGVLRTISTRNEDVISNLCHELGHYIVCEDPTLPNFGLRGSAEGEYYDGGKSPVKNPGHVEALASLMGIFFECHLNHDAYHTLDYHGWCYRRRGTTYWIHRSDQTPEGIAAALIAMGVVTDKFEPTFKTFSETLKKKENK